MDCRRKKSRFQQQTKKENMLFKRRKEGIKKKARELAILCDVPICIMIQSPEGEFEIWPENANEVRTIMDKYCNEKGHQRRSKNVIQNTGVYSPENLTPDSRKNIDSNDSTKGLDNALSTDGDSAKLPGEISAQSDSPLQVSDPNMGFGPTEFQEFSTNEANVSPFGDTASFDADAGFSLSTNSDHHSVMAEINSQYLLPCPETEVYDVPPLQVSHPNMESGPVELQKYFASTSIDFLTDGDTANYSDAGFSCSTNSDHPSFIGETNGQFLHCPPPETCFWPSSLPQGMAPHPPMFPMITLPEFSYESDPWYSSIWEEF